MNYNTVMAEINLHSKVVKLDIAKLTKERNMWQRRKNELMKVGITALD